MESSKRSTPTQYKSCILNYGLSTAPVGPCRAVPAPEAPCRACGSAEVQHHARSGRTSRQSEHLPTRDTIDLLITEMQTKSLKGGPSSIRNLHSTKLTAAGKLTQYESCNYDLWTLGRPHLRDPRSANSNQTARTITQQRRTMHIKSVHKS